MISIGTSTAVRGGRSFSVRWSTSLAVRAGMGVLAAVGVMKLSPYGSFRVQHMTTAPLHWLNSYRSQSTFSFPTRTTMTSLTPPQLPPKWTHTAEEVLALTKEGIARDREQQDKVAALAAADCSFSSVRDWPAPGF